MYFLYDLYVGSRGHADRWPANPMKFRDRAGLMAFWNRNCRSGGPGQYPFGQLNVTGRDTYSVPERHAIGRDGETGFAVYGEVRRQYLRRYLVTDGHGRHVDIRDWTGQECAEPRTGRCPAVWWRHAAKNRHHRAHGPGMARGTWRQAQEKYEALGADGWIGIPPVRNKIIFTPGGYDGATADHEFRRVQRSWKYQHRCRRQFQKHKAGCAKRARAEDREDPGRLWDDLAEAGFPVSPATLEEPIAFPCDHGKKGARSWTANA